MVVPSKARTKAERIAGVVLRDIAKHLEEYKELL
jgi:hypothetical protein